MVSSGSNNGSYNPSSGPMRAMPVNRYTIRSLILVGFACFMVTWFMTLLRSSTRFLLLDEGKTHSAISMVEKRVIPRQDEEIETRSLRVNSVLDSNNEGIKSEKGTPVIINDKNADIHSESSTFEKEQLNDIDVVQTPDSINQKNDKRTSTYVDQSTLMNEDNAIKPKNNVHIFYYAWWGAPGGPVENDRFIHWNHEVLPHWRASENENYKGLIGTRYKPPEEIGANFFPQDGPYSSSSPEVIARHMQQIRESGASTVVLSWYPPDKADDNGIPQLADPQTLVLLDACAKEELVIAFQIEPYKGRTAESIWNDAEYISLRYGSHPALARVGSKKLPLLYVYDSYLIPELEWRQTTEKYRHHARNAVYLGLVVEERHLTELAKSQFFDGLYTYFAADGFVWGSTRTNWKKITQFGKAHSLLTSISFGPGYLDTRIRPWNAVNSRPRVGGKYYLKSFRMAAESYPDFLSITSWNEWHEGTQIEPAVPKPGYFDYSDTGSGGPDAYLRLTRESVDRYAKKYEAQSAPTR